MKLEDAIEAVLREHGSLTCNDIASKIKRHNLAKLGGKTPISSVRSCMIRAPHRFTRIGMGVYDLKQKTQPATDPGDGLRLTANSSNIAYQYTEKFIEIPGGGYYQILMNDVITGIIAQKPLVPKALKTEFPEFTKDNFPCVYILNIAGAQNEIYVGESNEALVRMGHWGNRKDYTHVAIIHASRFTSGNIRKNIERIIIESFEKLDCILQNKNKTTLTVGPEEKYPYEQLEKIIPIVITKIASLFTTFTTTNKTIIKQQKMHNLPKQNKSKREPVKWSKSLNSADESVRELTMEVIKTIASQVGGTTFESAWFYFGDGEASRKKAFAALAIKKHGLDLVFLFPEDATLPINARRLKPFVLSRQSECRLRLDKTNLDTAVEIAAKSRDYMRSLAHTGAK